MGDNSDECSTNASGENLSSINRLNLTLENFDQDDFVPENCPYVLTSPRSIEACKIVGIRPVDLLPFRLEDARRELEVNGDFTLEALNVLRTAEDNRRVFPFSSLEYHHFHILWYILTIYPIHSIDSLGLPQMKYPKQRLISRPKSTQTSA